MTLRGRQTCLTTQTSHVLPVGWRAREPRRYLVYLRLQAARCQPCPLRDSSFQRRVSVHPNRPYDYDTCTAEPLEWYMITSCDIWYACKAFSTGLCKGISSPTVAYQIHS